MYNANTLINQFVGLITSIIVIAILLAIIGSFIYMLFQWLKNRKREDYALDFVSLLVRLPKDNEIKIDAAEQLFASLYSLKKSGMFAWTKPEDLIAFEIVGLKEEISFYVHCSEKVRDLVEKHIHGAYPQAEIQEVDEVNIFSEEGRVAFAQLKFDKAAYLPIKTYKDLPTDGLSLITSALSKMSAGEGAILQIVVQPAGKFWQKAGHKYVSGKKRKEADPETASYDHDPKEIEAINNKIGKPGFRVAIRVVVSCPNEYAAESHLSNITGAFAQFGSEYNKIKKARMFIKHLFMIDFLYRYLPLFRTWLPIMNSEELATIFRIKLWRLIILNGLMPKMRPRLQKFHLQDYI